jgi:Ca-activated chloride channel family protein
MVQIMSVDSSMLQDMAVSVVNRLSFFVFVKNNETNLHHRKRFLLWFCFTGLARTSLLPVLFCILLFSSSIVFADVGSNMRRGNHLERKGEYEDAIRSYQEALVQEPDNPKIHYNLGRALYRLERYDEAISEFQLGFLEKDNDFKANVFYNIGNSQFKKGQLDAAIESYKMSLLVDHEDIEAKQNLEFCLRLKDQMQHQPQSDSTPQPSQQPPQQEQEQKPQPREGEIGKEEAERMLQALQSEEKENLEKSRTQERKENVEKDW